MAWSGYWYGRASGAYLGAYDRLGKPSMGLGLYLPDGQRKTVLQFRHISLVGPTFSDVWAGAYTVRRRTWHFSILRDGVVHQHYGTQAVTNGSKSPTGYSSLDGLEAWSVVVSFEPLGVVRHLCYNSSKGWHVHSTYPGSDLYSPEPLCPNDQCYDAGTTWFGNVPTTRVQLNAAIALARWLFLDTYKWGKPLKGTNVFGADDWGDAIFNIEPGPVPPIAIPWRHPVSNGCISQGYWGQAYPYGCGGYHRAIDIVDKNRGAIDGRAVYPAAGCHQGNGCRVVEVGYTSDMGNYIRLCHSDEKDYIDHRLPRIDTVYCHLKYKPVLSAGTWIDTGTIIGYVGGTPSFAPHLHLGVYEWPSNDAFNKDKDKLTNTGPYAGCEYRKDPETYIPHMSHYPTCKD